VKLLSWLAAMMLVVGSMAVTGCSKEEPKPGPMEKAGKALDAAAKTGSKALEDAAKTGSKALEDAAKTGSKAAAAVTQSVEKAVAEATKTEK
jgi:hypothetical protein